MDYTTATDDQLKTIIKEDKAVPVELLRGVVREMMNRNLLEKFIVSVTIKKFMRIKIACNVLHTTMEDIIQFGYMEIWRAVEVFNPGKASFAYLAHLHLYRKLNDWEGKFDWDRNKTLKHTCSWETPVGEVTLEHFLSSPKTNTEKTVIEKITLEEHLNKLDRKERVSFLLYLKGYSIKEIAPMVGCSFATAQRYVQRAIQKMSGRTINLGKLGFSNYRKGKTA